MQADLNLRRVHMFGDRFSSPKVIKLFPCSTQLSMKFVLVINLKLQLIANSFLLNIAEHENYSADEYENANYCWHFHIHKQRKIHFLLSMKNVAAQLVNNHNHNFHTSISFHQKQSVLNGD